ncbi:MAG: hypothetical protein RJA36_3965 [Pseudomonadota bacterium]|jgi:SPP1 family predicted phage head-tail adaptor
MPINAGDMRERITIQTRASGVDSLGQESATWSTHITCWASVEPLRGKEYFAAGQVQSSVDVRIRIRWREGIVPTMRVLWRGVAHDIVSVIEPRAGQEVLELMCSTAARDGR